MEPRNDGSVRMVVASCCWALGIVSLVGVALFSWLLRDGLGPDAVETQGWLAFRRFFAGAGWAWLVPVALLLSGTVLYRSDARRTR